MSEEKSSGQAAVSKGRRVLSALCNIIGILAVVCVFLMLVSMFAPRLFGCEVYNVVSGSMEPSIPVGSLILVDQKLEPMYVEEEDVIAFYMNRSVVTHRVVSNDFTSASFITKGDANEAQDIKPVPYNNYIGKIIFDVPLLGHIQAMLTETRGKIWLFCILAAGVLLQIVAARLVRVPRSE